MDNKIALFESLVTSAMASSQCCFRASEKSWFTHGCFWPNAWFKGQLSLL